MRLCNNESCAGLHRLTCPCTHRHDCRASLVTCDHLQPSSYRRALLTNTCEQGRVHPPLRPNLHTAQRRCPRFGLVHGKLTPNATGVCATHAVASSCGAVRVVRVPQEPPRYASVTGVPSTDSGATAQPTVAVSRRRPCPTLHHRPRGRPITRPDATPGACTLAPAGARPAAAAAPRRPAHRLVGVSQRDLCLRRRERSGVGHARACG